jgi:anti-anti-sigma factor
MNASKFVRAEQDGDVLVITPLFTYATFTEPGIGGEWAAVQVQLDAPATKHIVVDLGEIPYFGSTVLEWMSQLWKRVKAKGGKLAAIRPSPIGREVLNAARLEQLWGIFGTREEALAWLEGGKLEVGGQKSGTSDF